MIGTEPLRGKILIDVSNPLQQANANAKRPSFFLATIQAPLRLTCGEGKRFFFTHFFL